MKMKKPVTMVLAIIMGFGTHAAMASDLIGGGASWSGVGSTGQGFGVGDAQIGGHGDAFDTGLTFRVDGVSFNPTSYLSSGQTITSSVATLSNLQTQVQFYADTATPTLRTLITLTNNGNAGIFTKVGLWTNVGSDESTQTIASSDGDSAFSTQDRWLITDDSSVNSGDPANTHVIYGMGGLAPSFVSNTVFSSAGSQGVHADFLLNIAAGQSRSLLFFNQIFVQAGDARTAATVFDHLSESNALLAGLSAEQIAGVANWRFAPVPLPAAVWMFGTALAGWLGLARKSYRS
ncbi:hypothetical protein BJL95_14730 [Methylomonas sp. LWB]|uniref:hypothetical protein n=1 Tax=Methylomonas sp. LWB TaxID=1905845 RepID=UPI0008D96DC3|nr:hypothetical protein [Methylomonas sp. LWB]OHX35495.1 hypothetical protein BJL95_14730 [Methylomonas sp. LWB]